MAAVLLGINAKLYRGTAGSSAATEVTTAKDVTLELTWDEVKSSSRASRNKSTDVSLKDWTLSFSVLGKDGDAHIAAFLSAWTTGTAIALKALDKASGTGIDADFKIISFTRNEPEGADITVDIKVAVNCDSREPAAA